VYCPETSGIYLIPIEDIPLKWAGSLRVTEARNSQKLRIRYARDYEIGRVTCTRPIPESDLGCVDKLVLQLGQGVALHLADPLAAHAQLATDLLQ
jgi:hypothetical protein